MKGHKMKKKLPIKKRTSGSAGTSSYDSDIYSNTKLEVASTVSSSDLESSHSNVTESLLQPLPAQRHLQSIRTFAGIHAPATSSQVRLDERASQGWLDKSHSGSLQETHAQQHAASVAQGHMFQPSDDASSPRKLAIRRCPQASRGPQQADQRHTQPPFHSLFPSQQHPAPSPILEEPYDSDAGFGMRRPHQQATSGAPNCYNKHTSYRHSIAAPSSKLQAVPDVNYRPDYLNQSELGDGVNHAYGSDGSLPAPLWDQLNFGPHAPASPGSGTGSTSPQKLAIRRSNHPSGHGGTGVYTALLAAYPHSLLPCLCVLSVGCVANFSALVHMRRRCWCLDQNESSLSATMVAAGAQIQHSPDQSGYLSPDYMHAQHSVPHSPPRGDPAAVFAQRDAEYNMHAYQAQYMWQQQQQQRRASMGSAMLYHSTAESHSTAAASSRGLRWDAPQPPQDAGVRRTRNTGTPDKWRLPTAAELNLPGWY